MAVAEYGASGMHIDIPAELELIVDQEFATGRYGSGDDVLIHALKWLHEERQEPFA